MKGFDAVIVGAGPAGSATAIALARRGYDVALLDKQNFPREKLCGDFVNPINWPIFAELGVAERILAEPHCRVAGFRITACSGAAAEVSLAPTNQNRSFGLGLARARLDRVLLQRAQEVGATIRTGARLERMAKEARGWQLTTGAGESWRAKILIGADGRNSSVARRLRIDGPTTARGRSVGFQIRLEGAENANGRIEIHLFPGGYAGLVGVGDGSLNLGLAIDRKVLPPSGDVKEFLLKDRLAQNPALKAILQRHEPMAQPRSAYPVYFPPRRSFDDEALLVGDAARVTEPVTGEGIYFAMQSGLLAAATIDSALRAGDCSASFLRRYQEQCARLFAPRLRLNALLRLAIYRPALMGPVIRWSSKHDRMLSSLVSAVCVPAAVE